LPFSAASAVKGFWFRFGKRFDFISDLLLCAQTVEVKLLLRSRSLMVYGEALTSQIIGAAITVHRKLGPGMLESAYEACLVYELEKLGLRVERQKAVPLVYETVKLECGFRADLVVERQVVVELKCKEALHPVDEAQLLSHLRLLNITVGLLINFHVVVLRDGIRRMVNNYQEPLDSPEEKPLTAEVAEKNR